MPSSGEARARLAHRLLELRQAHWPDLEINQVELAEALGVGPSSISTWENQAKIPPVLRLAAYATFFATARSVAQTPYKLLQPGQLTKEERERRDDLRRELMGLRTAALATPGSDGVVERFEDTGPGLWHFPENQDITIVCARLSRRLLDKMPYVDPASPDYVELYTYADPDALIEAFGHIRAMNPANDVHFRIGSELVTDDYTSHLVLLGGVDWNNVTRDVLRRAGDLPVRQFSRSMEDEISGFEVEEKDGSRLDFSPKLREDGGTTVLEEDIAHVFRAVSPYNANRTVTICNGMFSRGVLGAVRAITDARFRDRNAAYVASRFGGSSKFSILSRVLIAGGQTMTPDWSVEENRLHEWPVASA